MHFSKAIILLAGIAAAVPVVERAPSSVAKVSSSSVAPSASKAAVVASSSKPAVASSSKAAVASSSKPATASATPATLSTAQVNLVLADLNGLDTAMHSATTAVKGFTGGTNIQAQGDAVETSGVAWQTAVSKLLGDVSGLKGVFCSADANKITTLVTGTIAPDLVTLFTAMKNQKSIFVQVGKQTHVYTTLIGVANNLQDICDALRPLITSTTLVSELETAGNQITAAANAAIGAYAG